ncbi:MAG: cytochrome c-type biogenesis CcmF C-terminal domain-containing protein, partial [Acidimicrobiales bacterium]
TVQLSVGESATIEDHRFTYLEPGIDVDERQLRVYALVEIDGTPDRQGDVYAPATTSFRQAGARPVPTPSVRSSFTEDIYLVLDEVPDPERDSIRLRVIIRPMVAWMWGGGALMALGTLLALFPGGRRRGTEPVSALIGRDQTDGSSTTAPATTAPPANV